MTAATPKGSLDEARDLDANDPLASLRSEFHIPLRPDGSAAIYFCGHSLGLAPKNAGKLLNEELHTWATRGVEGHFAGTRPWLAYHELLNASLAQLAGAQPIEVVAMNSLTVNLHLMLASFYRPQVARRRILIERGAFSTDRYAIVSQLQLHGFTADDLIEIGPRSGESTIRTQDICELITREGATIATVMLGGVQYLTGQCFDMAAITEAGHRAGCLVGFNLAHAIGNVPLRLHDWQVDFAVWCSYKYLNGGPGALGGCFVHEQHAHRSDLPRLAGWWGHDKHSRFSMPHAFQRLPGAEGWQLSNPPIFAAAPLLASLQIFERAGFDALRTKSVALTAYLHTQLQSSLSRELTIMTPNSTAARGAQLSLRLHRNTAQAKHIHERLNERGIFCDWREPDVIRVAPVPLYNSFCEVDAFVAALGELLSGESAT